MKNNIIVWEFIKISIVVLVILFIIVMGYIFINNDVTFYVDNKIEIKLVECIDGDTAKFIIDEKEEKVRFLGIDAPEFTKEHEEYGQEASDYTCELLKHANNIYIEYDSNSDNRDKYNRILGWLFVDNNNLSELLLSMGYAEVKYIYGNYKYIDDLCIAQEYAYKSNLGIWSINYRYEDNYCYKNDY